MLEERGERDSVFAFGVVTFTEDRGVEDGFLCLAVDGVEDGAGDGFHVRFGRSCEVGVTDAEPLERPALPAVETDDIVFAPEVR